ncbi:hypothetical protein GGI23_002932 [Coemansia sp. RSA 2559]|nr:hypothetical protein GGI23_002932 [Coemansia sp. RSA 2559]KAJ2862453.1 hypothetical protein GGI22_002188 [Coemansia erecta]
MYGGGLVTPGEVETFISQHKYVALAYYNHEHVTYYDYNSSTNKLIAYIVGRRNRDFGCQRFSSKHVAIPEDVAKHAPDRGVIFYRNAKQVAVMSGYDVSEFASTFNTIVEEGNEAEDGQLNKKESMSQPHEGLSQSPPPSGKSTEPCCLIL